MLWLVTCTIGCKSESAVVASQHLEFVALTWSESQLDVFMVLGRRNLFKRIIDSKGSTALWSRLWPSAWPICLTAPDVRVLLVIEANAALEKWLGWGTESKRYRAEPGPICQITLDFLCQINQFMLVCLNLCVLCTPKTFFMHGRQIHTWHLDLCLMSKEGYTICS